MKSRLFIALAVAALLIFFVVAGQTLLSNTVEELAVRADEASRALSEAGREWEGIQKLSELIDDFEEKRPFLGIFVNDGRIHEIQRALSRAKQLAEEGDVSPALEALTDLSETLKELSETHRPTWENIL